MQTLGSLSPTNFLCQEMQTAKHCRGDYFREWASFWDSGPAGQRPVAPTRNRYRAQALGALLVPRLYFVWGQQGLCILSSDPRYCDDLGIRPGVGMPGECMGARSHPADLPKSAPVPFSSFWLLPNSPSLNSHFRLVPPTLVPVLSPLWAPHDPPLSSGLFLVGQSSSLASRSVFHPRRVCRPPHAPFSAGWLGLDSGMCLILGGSPLGSRSKTCSRTPL